MSEATPLGSWTIAHYLVGVGAGALKINPWMWLSIHVTFEIFESSEAGIAFFNSISNAWKNATGSNPWTPFKGDSVVNSYCDTIISMSGWLCGHYAPFWLMMLLILIVILVLIFTILVIQGPSSPVSQERWWATVGMVYAITFTLFYILVANKFFR